MEKLSLCRSLYATSKLLKITGTPVKMNIAAPRGRKTSIHNAGPMKMSLAARALEYLLLDKCVAAYEGNAIPKLYVEIDDTVILTDGSTFETVADCSPSRIIAADVYYELSSFGENTELSMIFKEAVEEFNKDGVISEDTLFQFCDSYYYGCVKNKDIVEVSNTLVLSSVEKTFMSHGFDKHSLINSCAKKYLKKSSYDDNKSSAKTAKKKEKDFIQSCKEGEYKVSYEWNENQKKHIQSDASLDNFVSNTVFESLVRKTKFRLDKVLERMDIGKEKYEAIGQDYINCLMVGKPGTGKTTVAYALSAATGLPVYTVSISQNTDEDEFEGKTKIVDGHPQFVTTDFLEAFEHGGIVMLEEPNLANPAVLMGALGQAIEFPFIIKKNGYETIHRHPLCIIVGAMNIGTAGSKPLSQAFANRFKQTYILDDPTKESFIEILVKKTGKKTNLCKWVYEAYENVVNYLKSPQVNAEDIVMNLSLRTCFGAIENIDEGEDPIIALQNSLIGAIAEVDLEIARNAQSEILGVLRNPSF